MNLGEQGGSAALELRELQLRSVSARSNWLLPDLVFYNRLNAMHTGIFIKFECQTINFISNTSD